MPKFKRISDTYYKLRTKKGFTVILIGNGNVENEEENWIIGIKEGLLGNYKYGKKTFPDVTSAILFTKSQISGVTI